MQTRLLRRLMSGGYESPTRFNKTPQTISNYRIWSILLSALFLFGCTTTTRTTHPDGTVTEIKAGFGNRTQTPQVTIEPSPVVVEAGERLGQQVVQRASDALMQRAIDNATQQVPN